MEIIYHPYSGSLKLGLQLLIVGTFRVYEVVHIPVSCSVSSTSKIMREITNFVHEGLRISEHDACVAFCPVRYLRLLTHPTQTVHPSDG